MCGITGFWQPDPVLADSARALVLRMAARIAHRGPDGEGAWVDPGAGLALGHRRLAVVDLGPTGHQPMSSASARYVIAYNGEIYNHQDLRRRLENDGCVAGAWRGHSDTETLLAAVEAWGLKRTLQACIGMFALALWDRKERSLHLARDRAGEKPLYYGWQGSGRGRTLLFGSELRALKSHPSFAAEVNPDSLQMFMQYGYVPAPHTIYRGIYKLNAGTMAVLRAPEADFVHEAYWSAIETALRGARAPMHLTPEEAVDQLEVLLRDSIGRQMVADVPLGAFLSGGIDSSTVVALMQSQSSRPVKTFTIGFSEAGYNEAEHAKSVARHLRTDHTELYVSAAQAMEVIPRLPTLYCEPFADSSQIPTFLVSQLARQHVTVSLSGDAGDELFCGYNRYQMTSHMWRKLSHVPVPLRRLASRVITAISPRTWDHLAGFLPHERVGDKLHKGAAVLASTSAAGLYRGLISHWAEPGAVVVGSGAFTPLISGREPELEALDHVQRMMAMDMLGYLPDDILAKVDRAAMGVSLETRVPFLDHRVVEFAWRLPLNYKLRNGVTKWPLRQVLYRHVPRALVERPKMGFGVPIAQWLRGPLRGWAEELLCAARLRREGYFHPDLIHRKWAEHLSGQRDWAYHLWDVLMFQAWREEWLAA